MEVLAIVGLIAGIAYGVDHEWQVAKAYKSFNECRAVHPKTHNTMTSWKYDPCNAVAFTVHKHVNEK